ncbi:hypothetical protein [Azohydromonas caseinilytica]|uniref:PXPV repeat-containing protein n=1 Tax=Azohydromonas caseinilytica TaxID=2728836 RepID=A0A848F899_9BURK|nr:hypothetical protein [Azohydromonas caseinilytica]NML15582.1 hypothetical protein [Azohydromonas caseinilytica]
MKRSHLLLSSAVLSLAGLLAMPARAGDVQWSVGINAPVQPGVSVGTVISSSPLRPAPVYVSPPGVVYVPPPPVYVSPPPLYVPRPPAYVAPPPIYYAPPPVYAPPPPVYVPAAPRYLTAPPVVYVPTPVYRQPHGWRGHHGHWQR